MAVTIPIELIEAYQNKKLNLFVGAGVSSSSGMIGWDDLIAEIKDIIRRENSTFDKTELENFLNSADHFPCLCFLYGAETVIQPLDPAIGRRIRIQE